MKLFSYISAFLICVSGPVLAADSKLLKKAEEIVRICQDHMPDSKGAAAVFKESGFRFEGIQSQYRVYSLKGRRIIGATTITKAKFQGCLVAVSKMTPAEGESMIQPWLKASNAKLVKSSRKGVKTWYGTYQRAKVRLEVIDHINFGIMRGAAITVRTVE